MTGVPNETTMRPLFQSERQREIMSLALEHGRVDVAELAKAFDVTTETIRRDLSELQEQRLVRRVHGGAVTWETSGFEPLLAMRSVQNAAEKRRIGRLAVNELPETGTILIDSGSTLQVFSECIPKNRALRVVTNSIPNAQALSDAQQIDLIVIGGAVRKNTLAMVDAQAVHSVEELLVDTLFISGDGLSPGAGMTTPYREEAALKRAMIAAADRVVVLADHSKFGVDHHIRFAEWSGIDVLITDDAADPQMIARIEALGPTVRIA